MSPRCIVLVCSGRRLLADRHSLPFPWTLSLRRRWCPSASHRPVSFLFLLDLSFPLCFPFLSLVLSLHRPGGGGVGGASESQTSSLSDSRPPPLHRHATHHPPRHQRSTTPARTPPRTPTRSQPDQHMKPSISVTDVLTVTVTRSVRVLIRQRQERVTVLLELILHASIRLDE